MDQRYEAVLFDMDGTLFDTERQSLDAWAAIESELGVRVPEKLGRSFIGLARPAILRLLRSGLAGALDIRGAPSAEEIYERHLACWHAMRESAPIPLKGRDLPGLLAGLAATGVGLAVASSSERGAVERNLERAGIAGCFTALVCGTEVGHGKPAPDIYLAAADLLGASPASCLVVEDAPLGVEAGVAAGMDTVFVPDLVAADARVRAACIAVFDEIDEIAGLVGAEPMAPCMS